MTTHIANLIAHCLWADRRMLGAIEADERLSADAELLRTFAHIFAAQHIWLVRMRGEKPDITPWPSLSHAESTDLARQTHDELTTIAGTLTPETLARTIDYVNMAGQPFQNSAEEILSHVAMHSMYHRGQLVKSIRRIGGTPPSTDYIVWRRAPNVP
jgi:uncharacterized damage-inducible protein DinB